jgi:hypothetical protein
VVVVMKKERLAKWVEQSVEWWNGGMMVEWWNDSSVVE